MTMQPHLSAHDTPKALIEDAVDRCRAFGKVTRVSLFCHHERPRMILCSVYMESGANEAADVLHGHALDKTVCAFHPVNPHFNCPKRNGASLKVDSCIDCNVSFVDVTARPIDD
jgi:hypothetical protein